MPNYCASKLTIRGAQEDLDEFAEFAKGPGPAWDGKPGGITRELDLNKFIPVPAELLVGKDGRDAYNSGGYDWCIANWGTKWGCVEISVKAGKKVLVYDFLTAWSQVGGGVLVAMSERFPELEFQLKFAEQGFGFAGIIEAAGGVLTRVSIEDSNSKLVKGDKDLRRLLRSSG